MTAFDRIRPVAALLLAAALAACGQPAVAPPDAQQAAKDAPKAPLVGVHYFGTAWPMNFIGGFRRAAVPGDFRRIADDGFNSVVLLVSWGDFQPVTSPCCQYDERAWERLHFLLEQARLAKLQVVLRVGCACTFHPLAGGSGERVQRLLNQPAERAAYLQFVQRLGRETAGEPQVVLTFMSWEDQWLRSIDESGRADFQQFAATRPDAGALLSPRASLPTATGDQAELFNAYWDWLVIEKLYTPATAYLPSLSYEARIDKEPAYVTGPDGVRRVDRWLGHEGMLRQRPGYPVTMYWAPFWGAANQGEKLDAKRSLKLLRALLKDVRQHAAQPLFIDQFNVIDNTVGFEANAQIRAEEIPPFLDRAACTLKTNNVMGYAFWTGQDYAENKLYNPAFGYGLDGWQWQGEGDGRTPLEAMPMGDFQLRLRAGDGVSQTVPSSRGRVLAVDGLPDQACVTADVTQPAQLSMPAGNGPGVPLGFPAIALQTRCAAIEPQPVDGALDVRLALARGELALRDVRIFDHVQLGGMYDLDGRPGAILPAVRKMNHDFREEPSRCEADATRG